MGMDTRQEPFGNHPDGGSIKEFASDENMPEYMLPLDGKVVEILNNILQEDRVDYILNSTEPELEEAKTELKRRLKKVQPNYYSDKMFSKKRF